MVCAVITGASVDAALRQIEQVRQKADWVELRFDVIVKSEAKQRSSLLGATSLPKILTFRRLQDGGNYLASEAKRREEMLQWARAIAGRTDVYMDLEEDLDEPFFCAMQALLEGGKYTILSHHNREKIPSCSDLDMLLERMLQKKAAFYKIAVHSQSCTDTLRFLDWAKQRVKAGVTLLAVSMGEEGEVSRILSRVLGLPFTYGFLEQQIGNFENLMDLYRVPLQKPTTRLYGLIGDPITESIGHLVHNQFFRETDSTQMSIDAVYFKMRVQSKELGGFFQHASSLPLHGLSVTMPLKERVLDYLDGVDAFVQRSGAANTLLFQKEKWWGFNTDGPAIAGAVACRTKIRDKKILVLGTGGVAKAAAWAMRGEGAHVDVMGRDFSKALGMADSLEGKAFSWGEARAWKNQEVLIHCTPIDFPSDPLTLPQQVLFIDLRLQSFLDTQLQVRQNRGAHVIHGKEIFYRQADLQRKIWFTKEFAI